MHCYKSVQGRIPFALITAAGHSITTTTLLHVPCCTQVTLFDVQQRITLAELASPFVKYVVWNTEMTQVCCVVGSRQNALFGMTA